MNSSIQLVECPRDAMQGWTQQIPTDKKVVYLQSLLRVGFHTLDFGSFVSPKAIPQMADTAEVLQQLSLEQTKTRLLAIVANVRGANDAVQYDAIKYLGFPFSISETFQQRNTNSSITESLERVKEIRQLCTDNNKELVIYISMGFGNPYGDPYSSEIVFGWANKIAGLGVKIISLADTVGVASPEQVYSITQKLVQKMPGCEIGVHLHSTPVNLEDKLSAALEAGCRRFDGALKGIGGCPMADDVLVGNMNTERMVRYLEDRGHDLQLDHKALQESLQLAAEIFI